MLLHVPTLSIGPARLNGVALTHDVLSPRQDALRLWVSISEEREWACQSSWLISQERVTSYDPVALLDMLMATTRTEVRRMVDLALPPF